MRTKHSKKINTKKFRNKGHIMLLKDFESASNRRFSVITSTLKENFNVIIKQDTSLKDLDKIAESVIKLSLIHI